MPKIASDGSSGNTPQPDSYARTPGTAPSAAPIPLADGRFYGAEPLTQTDVRP